ncbi:hypothetical protein DNTS_003605 [Danionella cerebrum]|uniref:LIM zinc-binding domain-containing protein n=2 Tax=Danionella cerebrum TaxID=2873325 RepID=A0A553QHD7_9TELE|nr:hypothetical protein DNTS_003605 [Danionella translucida]
MSMERFDCHYCKDTLLGKKYILKEDTQYCTKCYENLFANCCEVCSLPIGCNCKDLSYKDRHWHENCFKCGKCSRSLVDKPFAAKDELMLCTECYSHEYSSKCSTCKKTDREKWSIRGTVGMRPAFCVSAVNSQLEPSLSSLKITVITVSHVSRSSLPTSAAITTGGVTYHDKPWHRECFTCIGCKRQLAGQRFTSRENYPYCLDCFSNLYAKKCVGCTKPITSLAGAKYISFEERQWHSECFTCMQCSVSLVGRGFLTQRDDILCTDCGREK